MKILAAQARVSKARVNGLIASGQLERDMNNIGCQAFQDHLL